MNTCHACRRPIAQPAKGRKRRYCCEACGQRQCRRRKQTKARAVSPLRRCHEMRCRVSGEPEGRNTPRATLAWGRLFSVPAYRSCLVPNSHDADEHEQSVIPACLTSLIDYGMIRPSLLPKIHSARQRAATSQHDGMFLGLSSPDFGCCSCYFLLQETGEFVCL